MLTKARIQKCLKIVQNSGYGSSESGKELISFLEEAMKNGSWVDDSMDIASLCSAIEKADREDDEDKKNEVISSWEYFVWE